MTHMEPFSKVYLLTAN